MKHNAANERVKRDYFIYLKEAKGRNEASIDAAAKAISRFEDSTRRKGFGKFHREQVLAFKRGLLETDNARTGERLSKATTVSTLRHCRDFFTWLAREPAFKKHVAYADADYFRASDKDVTIARARRDKAVPTLAQVEHVLASMPAGTIVERRDRALIAFTLLTGARVGALASFRVGDVDIAAGRVEHDARHVQSKFAKTFSTFFMPVCDTALAIFAEWHDELSSDVKRGISSPLFPATLIAPDEQGSFVAAGLAREGWSGTGPVRDIFKRAFTAAGLPYFNPHSFRDMLVRHAMTLGLSPEEMKAWSQNLGHADVLTTFTSYGTVPAHRQGELIRAHKIAEGYHDVLNDPKVRELIAIIQAKAV